MIRRHVAALLALLVILPGLASRAVAQPTIGWEVENRFRFYTAAAFQAYVKTAQETRTGDLADWILRTEQQLQQVFFNGTSGEARWNGWAAQWRDDTCWDRTRFVLHERDRCEDYTVPVSHRVVLGISGLSPTATCVWTVQLFGERASDLWNKRKAGASLAGVTACDKVALEVPFSTDGDAGAVVSAMVSNNGTTTPAPEVRISVKDVFVLGMGDSLGAGVGNPDAPPRMDWNEGLYYDGSGFPRKALPVRKGAHEGAGGAAIAAAQGSWLDVRCYRSQYGPQFRAALHLAVDLRHAAITYLDLACDGSRIIEGLLHQKSLDGGFRSGTPVPSSQLGLASRLLCKTGERKTISYKLRFKDDASECNATPANQICEYSDHDLQRSPRIDATAMTVCGASGANAFKRNIDLLFLSIGGNDVGFAPMVGDVLIGDANLSGRIFRSLARDFGVLHDAEIGEDRLGFLRAKYKVLDEAIAKFLPLRGDKKPIFLTAYPLPVDDRDGKICGATNESSAAASAAMDLAKMFAHFNGPASAPSTRLKQVTRTTCLLNLRRFAWFDAGPNASQVVSSLTASDGLCAGLASAADGPDTGRLNWQFVADFLPAWRGHGVCSLRAGEQPETALSIPAFHGSSSGNSWTPPYESMRPYASRQRWIRTPNDAFVTTNWHTFSPRVQDTANLIAAATTSAMHPTAEGYARMADGLRLRVTQFMCSERAQEFGSEPMCAAP